MKIVLVTGGFDPVHAGHIAYFQAAKHLGDKLIVGLNSDAWLSRKKGRPFMSYKDRVAVVENLAMVDGCLLFNDDDDTASEAILNAKNMWPNDHVIFANGGDRTQNNIPEMAIDGVEFVFGVGGENKINSSSNILAQWSKHCVTRSWGSYTVLQDAPGAKVKTLKVLPGQALSMQRHRYRSEYWMVIDGTCMINMALPEDLNCPPKILTKYNEFRIPANAWHQLTNPFTRPCSIIEIQYGDLCAEDDIERLDPGS